MHVNFNFHKHNKSFSMEPIQLFLVLLGFALSFIFYKTTSKNMKKSKYPLPPGPSGYPIVGCLFEMLRNKPPFKWIHAYMAKHNLEIASFRLGNVRHIVVSSPELARKFLKEQDAAFASRPATMAARVASNGFLSAIVALGGDQGDQWKKMRKVVTAEVLSASVNKWLHDKRNEEADHLVKYVYNQCRSKSVNGVVNMRVLVRLYVGGVIMKMLFGKSFFLPREADGGPSIEEREHVDNLFTVLVHLYGFAICDYLPFSEIFDFDGHKKKVTNALKEVRKFQDPEIDRRIEMWRNGARNTNQDLLDVLINLKDSNNQPLLTTLEIKTQVEEIQLAAIDNPTNGVEWAIAEMIHQPHLLDLATKELDEVVGRERLVQESDLPRLTFIKACVREAFRMHPVTPLNLPHVAIEDNVVGGYFIPKGSHVQLSRIGLGRNPRVWEDPLKYKPERHLKEGASVEIFDPELELLSFSVGRRGCPAIKLGSTVTWLLLARLIQGFSWKTLSDEPLIDVVDHYLSLTKPMIARATPRLEEKVYEKL